MKEEIEHLKENVNRCKTEELKSLIKECPLINNKLTNDRIQHDLLVDIFKICLDKCEEYKKLLKMEIKDIVNIDDLESYYN